MTETLPIDPGESPALVDAEPSWQGWDPNHPDPARWEDPFPQLIWFREHAAVNQTPADLWRLFRYDDCVRVLREIPAGVRRVDGSSPGNAMGGAGPEGGQFMLQQDPPNHTRLRKLVSKAFTPRATERWRPRARQVVAELLEPGLEAGRLDVIADLALPLPSQLICEMLGVPVADRSSFTEWTTVGIHILRGSFLTPEERVPVEAAIGKLSTYFQELIAERRASPRDDLLSEMIRAEEEGDRLTADELLVQSIGLLAAGFETTIGLIGLGAKNLIDHPEELRRLREDPELIGSAVEECLRFEGPIGMTTRVLHADAEFGGRVIPCDTTVWLSIWSANRDPARFPDPERFDIGRDASGHLAFGGGTHMCLGAHLARMETQEALGALVARTARLERPDPGVVWGPSLFRVPKTLPVELTAA
jgi:cytochrome P450